MTWYLSPGILGASAVWEKVLSFNFRTVLTQKHRHSHKTTNKQLFWGD